MAYILSKIGQSFNIPIHIYEADTEEDMNTIDLQSIPMGSKCYIINNGKWYMLNSEGKWKDMSFSSGGGSVQSDWNQNDETQPDYVKNRPFYAEESNINITWDGNTTGLTASSENRYYKVSDLVFTLEEFEEMTFTDNSGSEYLIGSGFIINGNNVLSYYDFGPVIATIDNAGGIPGAATDIFPEAGVYFPANGSVVSLKGTERIVKLDNKFLDLPEQIQSDWNQYDDTQPDYIKNKPLIVIPFKPADKSYLTFSSPSGFTLKVNDATKHWDGTLEYFAYDKTWTTWDGTTTLSSINNDGEHVLYLRGTGNTKISYYDYDYTKDYIQWVINGTDVRCNGNIETLLDYATVEAGQHPTMADECFIGLFKGCTSLTQAPDLPATTLADSCYSVMFSGCTGLTQAPELPATTLADSCYSVMFSGCTGLTQAPELPATTLANGCYSGMFKGCTSLTQAPELPAMTLADYCYYSMFSGCTGLTKAPELPATTLANNCYNDMFSGCTSLTKAPELPATTLANNCYNGMFYGCTSLKLSSTQTGEYTQEYRIPSSGEGVAATDALADMFTSTGGTFTGTPAINTTYYLSSDNMIVRETEIATLNGYVGSMIDAAIDKYADTAEYIIPSSTQGSTKKFKITVDDSGTLTATEVV